MEIPLIYIGLIHKKLSFCLIDIIIEKDIAQGEEKLPISIWNDDFCEEFALPCLFPEENFEYKIDSQVKLSPLKYFNQWLLNYNQSGPDYIFFGLSVTQQLKLQNQINIAMNNVCTGQITASMLSQNFVETDKSFIAKYDVYHFRSAMTGISAYWKKTSLQSSDNGKRSWSLNILYDIKLCRFILV